MPYNSEAGTVNDPSLGGAYDDPLKVSEALFTNNSDANAAVAEAALTDFTSRYLGAYASDPALDLSGNPLQVGALYYNTEQNSLLVWNGTSFVSWTLGGGSSGVDSFFYQNAQVININTAVTSGKNAMSAGPITINSGVVVTVPSGSVWTVV